MSQFPNANLASISTIPIYLRSRISLNLSIIKFIYLHFQKRETPHPRFTSRSLQSKYFYNLNRINLFLKISIIIFAISPSPPLPSPNQHLIPVFKIPILQKSILKEVILYKIRFFTLIYQIFGNILLEQMF